MIELPVPKHQAADTGKGTRGRGRCVVAVDRQSDSRSSIGRSLLWEDGDQ